MKTIGYAAESATDALAPFHFEGQQQTGPRKAMSHEPTGEGKQYQLGAPLLILVTRHPLLGEPVEPPAR